MMVRYFTSSKSLKITEETLKSRIENVETIKALKEGAIVTGAAVVQSEANQHAAEVLIPDLKQNIRETENALNILLGQAPGPIERGELGTQIIPEKIEIGLPAQLLNNRPDVRQAEFNFRVAFESTNLAKTYFYPSLTLTASAGFSNLEINDFFSHSIFYSIIGGLTQPIFNQGLNKMRLTTAQSQQLQAYNNFQQSLLVAGQEVSNAMYAYEMAVEKEDSRKKQIEALEKAGCEKIYQEKISGATKNRPELDKMIEQFREGDELYVWRLDRLGRSLKNIIDLVLSLSDKGIIIKGLVDGVDTSTINGRLFLNLMASLAEYERELIKERTNAGLQSARARGRTGGRPKGLTKDTISKFLVQIIPCSINPKRLLAIFQSTYLLYPALQGLSTNY